MTEGRNGSYRQTSWLTAATLCRTDWPACLPSRGGSASPSPGPESNWDLSGRRSCSGGRVGGDHVTGEELDTHPGVLHQRSAQVGVGTPGRVWVGRSDGVPATAVTAGVVTNVPRHRVTTTSQTSIHQTYFPATWCTSGAHILASTQAGHDLLGKTFPMSVQVTRSLDTIRGNVSGDSPELRTPR